MSQQGSSRRPEMRTNRPQPVASEVFDGLLAMLDRPGQRLAWMERVLDDPRFTNS